MLQFVRWCAAAYALFSTVPFASAQSAYPDKPIHFIVAFVPGGATDTFARQISNDLQNALGQPVVIENRPGAGGYLPGIMSPPPTRTAIRCCLRRTRSPSVRHSTRSRSPASIR